MVRHLEPKGHTTGSGRLAVPLPTCGHRLSRFCSPIPAGDAYNMSISKTPELSLPRVLPGCSPTGLTQHSWQWVHRPGAVLRTASPQVLLHTPVPTRGSAPNTMQKGQLDPYPCWVCGLPGVARPLQDQPKGTSHTGICVAYMAGPQLSLQPQPLFTFPWLHPVSMEPLVPGSHPVTLTQEQDSWSAQANQAQVSAASSFLGRLLTDGPLSGPRAPVLLTGAEWGGTLGTLQASGEVGSAGGGGERKGPQGSS